MTHHVIDDLAPRDAAEWQLELEEQWHDEDTAHPDIEPSLAIAVRAARGYSMRTLEIAFVYDTHGITRAPYDWTDGHTYQLHECMWYVKEEDVLYSTFDGWYDEPPRKEG